MENLSAVLHGVHDLRMEDHPIREPGQGEVQIRIHNCGMCMTDVHLLDTGAVGFLKLTSPYVMGHEIGGVVSKVGPDVTNVKPGDRVAVDPSVACGFCVQCRRGRSNTCNNVRYIGMPPRDGGYAHLGTYPAHCAHKIPESLDLEEAAMMEPLSVCVSAAIRADVKMGDNVIVFGAGPIGLMTLQVARARGASSVCVADIQAERLELARQLGATHTVLFRQDETDAQTNAHKLRNTLEDDIDIAIECSGVPLCLQTSIYAVRQGGVVAVVGLGPDDVTIPINDAVLREVDIRGCVCNNYCYPAAIKLVASQKVKVKPIISHRLRLEDVPHALDLARKQQVVKIMIDCAGK